MMSATTFPTRTLCQRTWPHGSGSRRVPAPHRESEAGTDAHRPCRHRRRREHLRAPRHVRPRNRAVGAQQGVAEWNRSDRKPLPCRDDGGGGFERCEIRFVESARRAACDRDATAASNLFGPSPFRRVTRTLAPAQATLQEGSEPRAAVLSARCKRPSLRRQRAPSRKGGPRVVASSPTG